MENIRKLLLLLKWCIYWYPFRLFIQTLPLRQSYRLADAIVPVQYWISRGKRKAIERGLNYMYRGGVTGERKVVKTVVKDTFRNALYSTIEALYYPKLTKKLCDNLIEVKGLANLDNALKQKRGAVLLHAHYGNAHIIMPAIGFKGYKLSQLGSRNAPAKMDGLIGRIYNPMRLAIYESKLRYKESLPVDFIYTDDSIRGVFRRLAANEVVSIGIDGREGAKSVEVDFLGRTAIFFTGTMRLLHKSMPVVLPTFHLRNPDGSQEVVIDEPMELEDTGNDEEDMKSNTKKFIAILERHVYSRPELYARVFWIDEMMFLPAASGG